MRRSLLMSHQNVAELGILGKSLVKRENRSSRKAEHDVDAFSKRLSQTICAPVSFMITDLLVSRPGRRRASL